MEYIREYNQRYSIEYAGKYGGHGELGFEYNFDKAYKKAIDMKRDHIQSEIDDDVLDKTIYIGVSSNDKFAIVYMTKEYFDHIKSNLQATNEYGTQWLNVAQKYLETGEPQIGEYSDQTEIFTENALGFDYLNITKIIDMGDAAERAFFNWMKDNNILWSQKGSDLSNILINKKDFDKIKAEYPEVRWTKL